MTGPALPADVPILDGWNVWDVLQAVVPIDPSGSQNDQLAAFVREAVGVPNLPIALTSSAAAGELVTSRAQVPELAGEPALGVQGSAIDRRTIAFELPGGRPSIAWPHDDNMILDAVYTAAPAPRAGGAVASSASSPGSATGVIRTAQQASLLPLLLGAGVLLTVAALARKGART